MERLFVSMRGLLSELYGLGLLQFVSFCFHEILGQRIHSLFKIAGSNRNNVSVCLGLLLRILLAKLDRRPQ